MSFGHFILTFFKPILSNVLTIEVDIKAFKTKELETLNLSNSL